MGRRGENIYKRKDGRWEGRYIKSRKINGSAHYGYVYGQKYNEVKDRLAIVKAQYAQQSQLVGYQQSHDSFSTWAKHWLETFVRPNLKTSTYVSYKNKLVQHVFPVIGEVKLLNLTNKEMEKILDRMKNKLANSSIQAVFRVLGSCLEKAVSLGLLHANPAKEINLPKIVGHTVKALSSDEQRRLVVEIENSRQYFPINLALQTGMRIGEICGLKWEDIDFSNQLIEVKRTLQRVPVTSGTNNGKKTQIIEDRLKSTSSYRKIPISQKLMQQLSEMKEQSIGKYVISHGKSPVEPRAVTYHFQEIREKLGLHKYGFHSLRHSFATRCLESGGNIATISSILGHASIKMTLDCYTNSFLSEERKLIQKMHDYNE